MQERAEAEKVAYQSALFCRTTLLATFVCERLSKLSLANTTQRTSSAHNAQAAHTTHITRTIGRLSGRPYAPLIPTEPLVSGLRYSPAPYFDRIKSWLR